MTHPSDDVTLFDYWRSSASYRVRIALNLAKIDHRTVSVDLLEMDHKSPEHLNRNPQGLVPVLDIDGHRFTQSLAIIAYLNETRDLGLLPQDPAARAKHRALAHAIAVDLHPVCNLSVLAYATEGGEHTRGDWMKHFMAPALTSFEALLTRFEQAPFCDGDTPRLADICLIPQLYNADRWGVGYASCPRLIAVRDACLSHPAFVAARPEAVRRDPAAKPLRI
jgi:maleylacetoacetate isomerase